MEGWNKMGKWQNQTLDDPNLDIKIEHIKNIKQVLNLEDPDSPGHAVLAFKLYEICLKWGLHFLPVRFLYDLDLEVTLTYSELKGGKIEDN